MRIAMVVQRYGSGVVGGAETHARLLAERLSKSLKWNVSIFTTTAADSVHWKPHFAPGVDAQSEGITIHRFRVRQLRSPSLFSFFNSFTSWFLKRKGLRTQGESPGFIERLWYRLQGPFCPDLIDSLQRSQDLFDGIIFFNYHSFATVSGLQAIRAKKILIPSLHEERSAYFQSTRRLLSLSDFIAVNSEEELSLLRRVYPLQAQKAKIILVGLDDSTFDSSEATSLSDLPETYVLYLGKVSKSKHVDRLIRNFEAFKRERVDNDLHLVLAGQIEPGVQIPDAPYFHYLGFVSDQEKVLLIQKSVCVINSSPLESLSLITLEALRVGVPILINEVSETLRYYMKWAPTVFGYRNESTFIHQLNEIASINWHEDPIRVSQIEQSRRWVTETFSWTKILEQLQLWLKK